MEIIPAKTIVTKNKNTSWFGMDYNMNLYRGCSHGCIYCDSRSACYRIADFSKTAVKENALEIVRNDLRSKAKVGVVGTGAMSDPYNPLEEQLQLTRHALELLSAFGFGAGIATKSDLVTRDIDVLQEIAAVMPVIVKITITCPDDALCKKLEPHAPPSSVRFNAIRALSDAGIFCGVLLMPVLPFLTDDLDHLSSILYMAKECGAHFVYPGLSVTLRDQQREYFYQQLERIFPGYYAAQYQQRYGEKYACYIPHAKEKYATLAQTCRELGLLYEMRDIIRAYKSNYSQPQLRLF